MRQPKSGISVLAITTLIQALASMASFAVPVLTTELSQSLNVRESLVGVYVSIIYFGAMVSTLASGDLISRHGPIRISQYSLFLCAAGLLMTTLESLGMMAVSALLIGFGYGLITPSSSHILVRNTPPHRMGLVFSLKQTGVPLGGVMAGGILPSVAGQVSWHSALLLAAVGCGIMALTAQRVRADLDADRNQLHPQKNLYLQSLKSVLAAPQIRALALYSLIFGAMQLCLTSFLVTYLVIVHNFSLVTAGFFLTLAQGAGVAGRLLWGWIADRWLSPNILLPLLALLMAVSSLALTTIEPHWSLVSIGAICVVFGASAIGWNGVYLASVARLAPAGEAAKYTGGTLFFTYLGVLAGPSSFAFVIDRSGSIASGFTAYGVLLAIIGAALLTSALIKK